MGQTNNITSKNQTNNTGNWLDKAISYFAPGAYLKRIASRQAATALASYKGAVQTRLSTGWTRSNPLAATTDYMDEERLRAMRDRARQYERDNPIACGILDRDTDNVISDGLNLQVQTEDPEWNKRAEALLWDEFEKIDVTGLTWIEHQRLVYRSMKRDGDVGCILLDDGRVQPIEGDKITRGFGRQLPNVSCGIEYNKVGRHTGYYVQTVTNGKADYVRIPAENFIFVPRLYQLSQLRGTPLFAQTFDLFEQIDQWIEAVIVAARIAACFGIVIKQENTTGLMGQLPNTQDTANNARKALDIEPGMSAVLNPGDSIETINPSQPQQSFPDNLVAMLRLLGLNCGMPLELVLMDFSRTNYSSARASLLQAYRCFKTGREIFVQRYYSRLYRWKVSKLIKDGKLPERPDAWNHRWLGQPWPYLDPVKELQAVQMGIDTGLDTITSAVTAVGQDMDDWLKVHAAELQKMRELGIPAYRSNYAAPIEGQSTPIVIDNKGE